MYRITYLFKEENNNLKCILINHLWIFSLISFFNILIFIKMYILYKVYKVFYLICTIVFIIFILIPIYPLIIIFKKNLRSRKLIFFKKISFIIAVITLLIGIVINLIIILNIYSLFTFYKECPYNYSYKDISNIFHLDQNGNNNRNNNYYSKQCSNKICALMEKYTNDSKFYSYLCNFDSTYDFENFSSQLTRKIFSNSNKEENDQIKCDVYNDFNLENKEEFQEKDKQNYFIIKSYFDICSKESILYKCNRYEKPKKYKIDYDISCPDFYDKIIALIFGIISIIFNLLCSLILTIYEFFIYKKILILYHRINNSERLKTSISGTTKNTSQIKHNNIDNNSNELNSQSIIIQPNIRRENQNNIVNNIDNDNKDNNIDNDNKDNNELNSENIICLKKRNNDTNQQLQNSINSERNKINFDKKSKIDTIDNNSNNSIQFKSIKLMGDFDKKNNKAKGYSLTESNNKDNCKSED